MSRLALVTFVALIALAGCSSLTNYERQGPAAAQRSGAPPSADTYVVREGDTLYSIAWRRGLDPVALAAWNGLRNPDRIFVGQRLRLTPAAGSGGAGQVAATGAGAASAAAGSAAPRSTSTARTDGSGPSRPAASAPARPAAAAAPVWQWPTRGQVVSRFGATGALTTGIAIAGSIGQDVVAAADGRVEYVGVGLVEYGQLIIISHGDIWISAYGYNQALLVAERDTVRRGQKIAEMGTGPGRQPRLHFEIRRYGEAVDPLPLLPPR